MEDQVGAGIPDLNEAERRLVRMMRSGEELDLAGKKYAGRPVPEKAMRGWGRAHTIRAAVIRDILLGRLGSNPDPHGIRLRGARISGRLDLEYVTAGIPLSLTSCLLTDGIVASGATLPALILRDSHLAHPDLPPLVADRLRSPLVDLRRSTLTASCETGGVNLEGADIGLLTADGATLVNEWGPAVDAGKCRISRDARFSRFEDEFTTRKFSASGRGDLGTIALQGARIDGILRCSGSIANASGPALEASDVTVGQNVILVVMEAEGDGSGGAVRLCRTHIGGSLSVLHANVTNETGPAVHADGLVVGQDVLLGEMTATAWGRSGAVRLNGGHIGGVLSCRGATLTNDRGAGGPALAADGLVVDQDVILNDGFSATGNGHLGVVRLAGAHIRGQLVCEDATLTSQTGPALATDGLIVGQDLYLLRVVATGGGDRGVLDLENTQVGGDFVYRPGEVANLTTPGSLVDVDGLTYQALPIGLTHREWLRVIRHDTPRYAAQPYQHLAAALSARGDDGEARDVLIAQRQDQLDRKALTGTGQRAWARFTGVVLGYGYRPSRALLYLLGVVIASVMLATTLGAHGALAQPDPAGAAKPAVPCTIVERIAVGLDLGEPLVSVSAQCAQTTTTAGDDLTILRWILQITAWALATLFVAGFTSAVRKT
jgi:hypothetical protein